MNYGAEFVLFWITAYTSPTATIAALHTAEEDHSRRILKGRRQQLTGLRMINNYKVDTLSYERLAEGW